jgi:hypothetical protein
MAPGLTPGPHESMAKSRSTAVGGGPTVSKAGSAAAQQPCPTDWQHPPVQWVVPSPPGALDAASQRVL